MCGKRLFVRYDGCMTDHPRVHPEPEPEESPDGEAMTLYHAYEPSLPGEVTTCPVSELDRRGLVCRMQSAQAMINRMRGVLYEAMADRAPAGLC